MRSVKEKKDRLRHVWFRRLTCGAVLLCGLWSAICDAGESERLADRLRVTFYDEDARFAESVARLALEQRPLLLGALGAEAPDTLHIHIAPTLEAFRSYGFSAIPDWGDGYAVPDLNLIVLQSPRISGSLDRLRTVLIHELAHVLLHSAMGSAPIPRWLDEGFAMYSAREWGLWDRAQLILATLTGDLVPLSMIHSVNTFSARSAELAYQESALAIEFILQEYGRNGLHALLARLRETGSIERACFDVFGLSIVEFERNWQRYVERTYGWRALPGEGVSLVAGPAIAILLALSYVALRRRRRAVLSRWEREETAEFGRSRDEDRWKRFKQRFTVIRGGKETESEK